MKLALLNLLCTKKVKYICLLFFLSRFHKNLFEKIFKIFKQSKIRNNFTIYLFTLLVFYFWNSYRQLNAKDKICILYNIFAVGKQIFLEVRPISFFYKKYFICFSFDGISKRVTRVFITLFPC